MKQLSDEILNKLIDNELNSSEIDKLYELIRSDDKVLAKAKAHQIVDDVLKKIPIEKAPADTTEIIMKQISNSVLLKEQKNTFFKFMITLFAASILTVIGFVFAELPNAASSLDSRYSMIKQKVSEYLPSFSLLISSNLYLTILSALTLVVMLLGYFVFEEHKSFKQKINSLL